MNSNNYSINITSNEEKKFLLIDIGVLFIGISFIGLGIFLFQFNPFLLTPLRDSKPIANIVEIHHNSQRKNAGTLNWTSVNTKEDLFNQDQILTEEESTAELVFDSGDILMLGPSTLIRIEKMNNEYKIELAKGQLRFIGNPASEIKVIKKETGKKLALKKFSAGASLEEIKATFLKEVKASAPPVTIITPVTQATELSEPVTEIIPSETIPLKESVKKLSEPVPENIPSKTIALKVPVKQAPVTNKVPKALPAVEAPSILLSQILEFVKEGDDNRHFYRIKLLPYKNAKKYLLEIYSDQKLKSMILRVSVEEPKYDWQSNRFGKFYYRVKVLTEDGRTSPYSKAGELVFPISPLEEL